MLYIIYNLLFNGPWYSEKAQGVTKESKKKQIWESLVLFVSNFNATFASNVESVTRKRCERAEQMHSYLPWLHCISAQRPRHRAYEAKHGLGCRVLWYFSHISSRRQWEVSKAVVASSFTTMAECLQVRHSTVHPILFAPKSLRWCNVSGVKSVCHVLPRRV